MSKNIRKTIGVASLILTVTVILALSLGFFFRGESGNVARIQINGEIRTETNTPFSGGVSSSEIVNKIGKAASNPKVEALLVEINSPGGTIVATEEISNKIESVDKPKVCLLRDTAASGGYWVASTCDHIIANKYTMTGSIGVTGSFLEFSELMDEYGINYVRLVSGEKKDMGTPYREPTEKEKESLKRMINSIHEDFVKKVSEERNLSKEEVNEIADGSVYTGEKALELGLVDELGGRKEAKSYIKNETDVEDVEYITYKEEFKVLDMMSQFLGKSLVENMLSSEVSIKV